MTYLHVALFWAGAFGCLWLWYYLQDRNDQRAENRRRATKRLVAEINRQQQERGREIGLELIEAQKEFPGEGWKK